LNDLVEQYFFANMTSNIFKKIIFLDRLKLN